MAGVYADGTAGGSTSYAVFTVDEAGDTWGPAKALNVPSQVNGRPAPPAG